MTSRLKNNTLELIRAHLESFPSFKREAVPLFIFNLHNPIVKFWSYITHLLEGDALPTVVSDADYHDLDQQQWLRGYAEKEHAANTLVDFNYHAGIGPRFMGLYLTSSEKIAGIYRGGGGEILHCKLDNSTALISGDELFERFNKVFIDGAPADPISTEIRDFISSLDANDRDKMWTYFSSNLSIYAMLLGYDGIVLSENCITLFNRGKIIVSQSEFDRLTSGTKFYDGGVIDFRAKYSNPKDGFPEK